MGQKGGRNDDEEEEEEEEIQCPSSKSYLWDVFLYLRLTERQNMWTFYWSMYAGPQEISRHRQS
ncbi:hypothetical protein EYF80_010979 [Liparis tanakae]|uniref:Uncharacterized protein n=1 Tax=Liparis tanakae TaxID=230148 RepID=A0A4Z2IL99_9TELE|nr:hypothetical protein EYF80_010979 [Liparis tanakae]